MWKSVSARPGHWRNKSPFRFEVAVAAIAWGVIADGIWMAVVYLKWHTIDYTQAMVIGILAIVLAWGLRFFYLLWRDRKSLI